MIAKLSGRATRLSEQQLVVDVGGVGYLVYCPSPLWEGVLEGSEVALAVHTYVREDRLELFGFASTSDRDLFVSLLQCSGIGPKTALQILGIPRRDLLQAALSKDPRLLKGVRGIGPKLASKVLVELGSLLEKGVLHPDEAAGVEGTVHDPDAIEALVTLGYDVRVVVAKLREAPRTLTKTEDRVRYVLSKL